MAVPVGCFDLRAHAFDGVERIFDMKSHGRAKMQQGKDKKRRRYPSRGIDIWNRKKALLYARARLISRTTFWGLLYAPARLTSAFGACDMSR